MFFIKYGKLLELKLGRTLKQYLQATKIYDLMVSLIFWTPLLSLFSFPQCSSLSNVIPNYM